MYIMEHLSIKKYLHRLQKYFFTRKKNSVNLFFKSCLNFEIFPNFFGQSIKNLIKIQIFHFNGSVLNAV